MRILDDIESIEQNAIISSLSADRNLQRGGLSAIQMKSLQEVYYQISETLISHFEQTWDVQDKEKEEIALYVLKLKYPATINEIKELFDEITFGKLIDYRSFKVGNDTISSLINSIGDLIK